MAHRERVSACRRQGVSAFAYQANANTGERISLYFLYPAERKNVKNLMAEGEAYRRIGVSAYRRIGVSAGRRVGGSA
jgi:hypothetical protein